MITSVMFMHFLSLASVPTLPDFFRQWIKVAHILVSTGKCERHLSAALNEDGSPAAKAVSL